MLGLYEHETKGDYITWSNKHSQWLIYSRIGKVACNRDWFQKYPNNEIEILRPHMSDHAPLRLR